MPVTLEASHHAIREGVGKAVKRARSNFSMANYSGIPRRSREIISSTGMSPRRKKEQLLAELRKQTAVTFGIPHDKLPPSQTLFEALKRRVTLLRGMTLRLQHINQYLEQSFLEQTAIKPLRLRPTKKKTKPSLGREALRRLEVNAYHFMEQVLEYDKKAIAGYRKKEASIVTDTRTAQRHYGNLLQEQTALLEHLEAKLPPHNKFTRSMLTKTSFMEWSSRVLSLVTDLLHRHKKEQDILKQIERTKAVKQQLDKKISYLADEYSKVLKIEHEKYWSLKGKGGSRLREAALEAALASQL